jgi:large subunit ribosomal protein L5
MAKSKDKTTDDKPKDGKSKDGKSKDKAKDADSQAAANGDYTPRLMARYQQELLPALSQKLGRKNRHSLPRLTKIVVNMGVGAAITEKKHLDEAVDALAQITGQKPQICRSRKSIAGFKLREGMAIGCKVTIRGKRMYDFLDRLISLALPRVRDFRGLDRKLDGHGNFSLGLSEQLAFPELNPDKINRVQGMTITICTTAASDEEGIELLRGFGMPFKSA